MNNNNQQISFINRHLLFLHDSPDSHNYYVLLLSSHTLSQLFDHQTNKPHTHTHIENLIKKKKLKIPKVQGPGRLIMVGPLLNYTHTRILKQLWEKEPEKENIESKVIPPHHLILICQSFSFSLLQTYPKRNKFSFSK